MLASGSWNDSRRGVEGELPADAMGDVAQVAEPGAQVADLDVGVGLLAALDAVEEVLNVLRLAFRRAACRLAPSPCSTRQPFSSTISVPLSP